MNEKSMLSQTLELLRSDLARYADAHRGYRGCVEREQSDPPIYRLRSYSLKELDVEVKCGMIPDRDREVEFVLTQIAGASVMDRIARRVIQSMEPYGIRFPLGITDGARVMAWVLADAFTSPRMGSAFVRDSPFEAIRDKLTEVVENEALVSSDRQRNREDEPDGGSDHAALRESAEKKLGLRKPTTADRSAFYALLALDVYIAQKYENASQEELPSTRNQKRDLLALIIDKIDRAEYQIDDSWTVPDTGKYLFTASKRFSDWIAEGNPDIIKV